MKYTKRFHSNAFRNIPKFFFGMRLYHLATLAGSEPFFSAR
jgi:hypothetical protein